MFTDMAETEFTPVGVACGVLYGERLQRAIDRRSERTGQEISRKDVAAVAKCSVQNIGMD